MGETPTSDTHVGQTVPCVHAHHALLLHMCEKRAAFTPKAVVVE